MGRFLRELAGFVAIQALVAGAWLSMHEPFREDYMAATVDKHRRLEATPAPRLIVVGGSAAAFGVDSAALAERGFTPVNMGLHSGVGLEFMLREIKGALRAGDVVVLSLEYGHFASRSTPNVLLDALGHRPAGWASVPLRVLPQLSDQLLPYLGAQLRQDVRRLRGTLKAPELPYRRSAFDEYGDEVADRYAPPPAQALRFQLERISPRWLSSACRQVADLAGFCAQRGVSVFLSYPPIPEDGCRERADDLRRIESELERRSGIARLEAPGAECYPRRLFYDTFYHLTAEGRRRRAESLLAGLAARGIEPPRSR